VWCTVSTKFRGSTGVIYNLTARKRGHNMRWPSVKPTGITIKCVFAVFVIFLMVNELPAAKIAPNSDRAVPIRSSIALWLWISWLKGFYIISIPRKATKTAPQSYMVSLSCRKYRAPRAVKTGLVQKITEDFENEMNLSDIRKLTLLTIPKTHRAIYVPLICWWRGKRSSLKINFMLDSCITSIAIDTKYIHS
jgi:hypothetical protein